MAAVLRGDVFHLSNPVPVDVASGPNVTLPALRLCALSQIHNPVAPQRQITAKPRLYSLIARSARRAIAIRHNRQGGRSGTRALQNSSTAVAQSAKYAGCLKHRF